MRVIEDAIAYVDNFKARIARLKGLSPVYPKVYTEEGMGFWVSTLVHWEYNGVVFSRHHVESGILSETYSKEQVLARLHSAVSLCKEKAIPCQFDDVVGIATK